MPQAAPAPLIQVLGLDAEGTQVATWCARMNTAVRQHLALPIWSQLADLLEQNGAAEAAAAADGAEEGDAGRRRYATALRAYDGLKALVALLRQRCEAKDTAANDATIDALFGANTHLAAAAREALPAPPHKSVGSTEPATNWWPLRAVTTFVQALVRGREEGCCMEPDRPPRLAR